MRVSRRLVAVTTSVAAILAVPVMSIIGAQPAAAAGSPATSTVTVVGGTQTVSGTAKTVVTVTVTCPATDTAAGKISYSLQAATSVGSNHSATGSTTTPAPTTSGGTTTWTATFDTTVPPTTVIASLGTVPTSGIAYGTFTGDTTCAAGSGSSPINSTALVPLSTYAPYTTATDPNHFYPGQAEADYSGAPVANTAAGEAGGCDDCDQKVTLPFTIAIGGTNYSSVYVDNNGLLSFEAGVQSYNGESFPIAGDGPLIAPYWADVDTRDYLANGPDGVVSWGTTTYNGQQAWGATWTAVGDYNENESGLNTFQVLLVQEPSSGANSVEAVFNYGPIQWTEGSASTTEPHIGYDSGDGVHYDNVVTSPAALNESGSSFSATPTNPAPGRYIVTPLTLGSSTDTTPPVSTASVSPSPNTSGWENSPTTVTVTATDPLDNGLAGSGVSAIIYSTSGAQTTNATTVQATTATIPITASGSTTVTYYAVDNAGNVESSHTLTVNLDTTTPTVTGVPQATPSSGWYSGPFQIAWTATDTISGLAPSSLPAGATLSPNGTTATWTTTADSEGSAVTQTESVTSVAGNVGSGISNPAKVDLTAPVSAASVNANTGWLRTLPVQVQLSATDNLSGVATIHYTLDGVQGSINGSQGTVDITTSGHHSLSYYATDVAGNAESAHQVTVMVDTTAPGISASLSPQPNAAGWNNQPVTVTLTCVDPPLADGSAGSGVATCSAGSGSTTVNNPDGSASSRILVSSEGRNVVNGTTSDNAGNTASSSVPVNIDTTAPQVIGTLSRQPDHDGWYNAPVSASFACTDPPLADGSQGSGVASCPSAVQLNSDGADQSVSAQATDEAGNVGHTTISGINIDTTPPTVTYSVNGSSTIAPWYNAAVTVAFQCSDATSGVASCPQSVVLSNEGRNQSVTETVYDNAGNPTTVTVGGINIDMGAPVVTGHLSVAPNKAGWNNSPVIIHWTCTDPQLADGSNGSGVVDCPSDQTAGTDGVNQVFTAQVHDAAGNASAVASVTVNLDQTAPSLSGAPTTQPNSAGWYNAPVDIHWTGTDALSGVDPATLPADSLITGEGTSLTATASVSDLAGNSTTATSPAVNIDQTPPVATATLDGTGPNGWITSLPAQVQLSATDNLSGVAEIVYTLDGQPEPPITASSNGTAAGTVSIPTDGRHVITYYAVDVAGNQEAPQTATVNIDTTAPVITPAISPTPVDGWNNSAVSVSLTCSDPALDDSSPGSGVASCSSNPSGSTVTNADGTQTDTVAVSGEADHVVNASSSDVAGNQSSLSVPVDIDTTGPNVTATPDRAPDSDGWYNQPVTVTFTCSDPPLASGDPGSGVASCPQPQTVSTDTDGTTVTGTAYDLAGNAGTGSLTVKVDTTPPSVAYTVNGSTTIAPWYNGPVTITFTCSDSGSGLAAGACPSPVTLSNEGRDETVQEQVRDVAGNTTDVDVAGINIDETPPAVSGSASPAPNQYGWNDTPVTVTWQCSDPNLAGTSDLGSGVVDCPASQVLGQGSDQTATAVVNDAAGNTSPLASVTANVDLIPPTLSGAVVQSPDSAGWYNTPVTVHWTASDAVSGIDPTTEPPDTVVAGQGANQSALASVSNLAGLSTTASVGGIDIDTTPPVTSIVGAPTTWTNQGVTLTLSATDNLSGVAATYYSLDGAAPVEGTSIAITTEGRHTVSYWSVDRAGNTESPRTTQVLIDESAPTISYSTSPVANGSGWNNTPVTVTFSCADPNLADGSAGSGLTSCSTPGGTSTLTPGSASGNVSVLLSTEGAAQAVNASAADQAGNTSTASVNVSIDRTAPTISGGATSPPNANGWYQGPVNLAYTCNDPNGSNGTPGSGIASCTSSATISSEGAGQSYTARATDQAGNTSSKTTTGINIDETPPTLTTSESGKQGNAGWYVGPVTVHFNAADALSGVDPSTVPADVVLTGDGANQSVTRSVSDLAGNTTSTTASGINIDQTPPTVVINQSVAAPNANGWYRAPVTVSFVCSDSGSGVAPGSCPASYTLTDGTHAPQTFAVSDVAGNQTSVTVQEIDIDTQAPTVNFTGNAGVYSLNQTVQITCQASDSGSGIDPTKTVCPSVNAPAYTFNTAPGSSNTLNASATDLAGNSSSATTSFVVGASCSGVRALDDSFSTSPLLSTVLDGLVSAACASPTALGKSVALAAYGIAVYLGTGHGLTSTQAAYLLTFAGELNSQPTVYVSVNPPSPNVNGWYDTPVQVSFLCTDATSGLASGACPSSETLSQGEHTERQLVVTNKAGVSTSVTVPAIDVDLTPPTVGFSGNAGTYALNQTIDITCTATDVLSGVDSKSTTCPSVSEPAWEANVGPNVLTAVAHDLAGNQASASTTYTVVVNCPGVSGLISTWDTSSAAASLETDVASMCAATNPGTQNRALRTLQSALVQNGNGLDATQASYLVRVSALLA
jgi:large repetitive protein